jgi:hypothetical protein
VQVKVFLIIDEISFMSVTKLASLNRVLKKLGENYIETYGGINVVFCGDFRQFEPVGNSDFPIYKVTGAEKQLSMRLSTAFRTS